MHPHPYLYSLKGPGKRAPRNAKNLLSGLVLIAALLTACGRVAGQGSVPGKEEFGMTKDELVTSIESVEAAISSCMRDAGFEYIAADYNTVRRGMTADKSLPGMGEREFMAEYGYGISTLYTGLAPQTSELDTPAKLGLGEQNVRIFQSLSAADQVAYTHTLFGEHPDATFAVALETEDLSRTGGCTRTAIEQVFKSEHFSATYLNPFDALVEQDPRMIAASGKYSECLRDAGFEYNFEREIEPDLRKRLDAVTGGLPLVELSPEARAALTELQAYEKALAGVAVGCEARYLEPVAIQVELELYAGPQQ